VGTIGNLLLALVLLLTAPIREVGDAFVLWWRGKHP
jgi:hypothetical protein